MKMPTHRVRKTRGGNHHNQNSLSIFLDDNFSDVMRSSAIGSNISSLFNITTLSTTHNEQKVTLDWVLPDGRNSQLATKKGETHSGYSNTKGEYRSDVSFFTRIGTIL